jgi:hypothetical protein
VQSGYYWFGTEFGSNYPWNYNIQSKSLSLGAPKSTPFFAVAVHGGDVANFLAPATIALLALGLIGIDAARRKQARPIDH